MLKPQLPVPIQFGLIVEGAISEHLVSQNWPDLGVGSYEGYGNGGGNTIYRLREGIERFLITDINNPASNARAQSEIS